VLNIKMIESIAKLLPDDVWTTTSVAGPEGVVHAVLGRLWRAPEFHREIEILSDGSLVGCACDQTIADEKKREATRAFSASRQYSKAIFLTYYSYLLTYRRACRFQEAATLFTNALQHTDESSSAGRASAAKLYANRAQCCLKLRCPGEAF
jgi:tetratricopeptide (TPR) repeat protein